MPTHPPYLTMPFAPWLLLQHDRDDDIGRLARAARKDRDFPRRGTWEQVTRRLIARSADGGPWAAARAALYIWREAGYP